MVLTNSQYHTSLYYQRSNILGDCYGLGQQESKIRRIFLGIQGCYLAQYEGIFLMM